MLDLIWNLFFSFFKVGALSFGGAYSLIPIIEKEVVVNNQWLSNDEFIKVLGMVEIFPGAISIKFATYTGYKTAGISGIIAANLGNMIIPVSLIILTFHLYSKFEKNEYFAKAFIGIKYAVIGMIIAIMINYFFKGNYNYKSYIFLIIGLLLMMLKVHPALVIVISSVVALILL
jgi:chromate transporter